MTTALEMFDGVKFELDQVQSAEFDVQDFNFFIAKATEQCVKDELDQFDLTQKVSDKLAPLVVIGDPVVLNANDTTDVRLMNLPSGYRHVVSALVRLRYKVATTSHLVGDLVSKFAKRLTGDANAFIMDNYYHRPLVSDSSVRLYRRVIGSKLSIVIDTPEYPESKVVIKEIILEYIQQPPAIELNEDFEIVQDTVFPEHFNREIVKKCAQLFLENSSSPRLQSHNAVNN